MAFNYSPKIVTDGLVFYLDAANTKSYPGSGTVWSDLSRGGNNGTLINGPTFNSANGGSVVFDGVNDYAEVTNRSINLEFQPTEPYSCMVFFKSPSNPANGALISNLLSSSPFMGWDLWFNNSTTTNTMAMHLISSWSANALKVEVSYDFTSNANKWNCMGYSYNGSCPTNQTNSLNSVNFYLNGKLHTSGKSLSSGTNGFNSTSETISYNSSQRFRISSRWASGAPSSVSQNSISYILIYNKELSASDFAQNYNATKSRFGL